MMFEIVHRSEEPDKPWFLPRDHTALITIHNKRPMSSEILMFACLQKEVKQCCDAIKHDCTYCAGQQPGQ